MDQYYRVWGSYPKYTAKASMLMIGPPAIYVRQKTDHGVS